MSEPRLDWALGIALSALLFFPMGSSGMDRESRGFYKDIRQNYGIPIMPPAWLFGPVWFALYIFMSTAITLWSNKAVSDQTGWIWWAVWITAMANFFFNKIWTLLFFGNQRTKLAAVDAVLIFLSAVLVLIFICLESSIAIASVVLWSIYVAWTLFAMILSIWIAAKVPTEDAAPLSGG